MAAPARRVRVLLVDDCVLGRAHLSSILDAPGILARATAFTAEESADTAVVYGVRQAAVETGAVAEALALGALASRLVRFARET
jgi:chemotaxis response regulator CheB